jgi:HD-like signal output (HDOD) protein
MIHTVGGRYMLLGLVSIVSIVVGLIGAAVWLLTRRPAPKIPQKTPTPAPAAAPAVAPATTPAADATGTLWVFPGQEAANAAPTSNAAPLPEVEPLTAEETYLRLHRLSLANMGVGEAWPGAHDELIASTAAVLQSAATEDRYTPRRPSLLPQLLRAVNDEEVSRRELVAIISRDPSLVGNLLKMANSPFYRVKGQAVESIDRAVVILGNDGIRSLIAAALAQPIFQIRGGDFPRFPEIAWEHTFRTASATVTHSAIVEKSDPFAAQLLGLVHGMAAIVVFRVALDQYEARPRYKANASVIASLLDSQTPGVAKHIAASWGLSDRILTALDDQTAAVAPDKQTPMGRSLEFGRLASALAVLHVHGVLDDVTAQISLPVAGMPANELTRLWSRLTSAQETEGARKKPLRAAAR